MPVMGKLLRNLAVTSPVEELMNTLHNVQERTNDSAINSLVQHDRSYLADVLSHHSAVYRNSTAQQTNHLDVKRRFVVSYQEPEPEIEIEIRGVPLKQVDALSNVLMGQSIGDEEAVTMDGVVTAAGILIRESALERIESRLMTKLNLEQTPTDNPNDYRPSGARMLSNASKDNVFRSEYLSTLHMDVIECQEYYSDTYTAKDGLLCDEVRKSFEEDNLVTFVGDDALVTAALVPDSPSRIADRAAAIRNVSYFGFPNDRYFRRQWSHVDTDSGVNSTNWFRTWYQSPPAPLQVTPPYTHEQPIVVAVIDSGVNYMNKDLQNSIYYNSAEDCTNGEDDDYNGYIDDCFGWNFVDNNNDPMDDSGHGSATASLIAASGSNQYGIAPFCWNCVVLPIKAIDENNSGATSTLLKGINYALLHKVKISNNSYGAKGTFSSMEEGVKRAQKRGMIFVAAAGNFNKPDDPCDCDVTPVYPASLKLDNVVSVASAGPTGALSSFSCYGKNTIHLAAPGERIIAAGLRYPFTYNNGTSLSAPIVTGIIASIWNENQLLSYKEVITILLESTKKLPWLRDSTIVGGIPDLYQATYLARLTRGRYYSLSDDDAGLVAIPDPECDKENNCKCPAGYEYKNQACEDINECKAENACGATDPLDRFRLACINTAGGYKCECRAGFVDSNGGNLPTQLSCVDVNECTMNTAHCPANSECLNIPGGYECICDQSEQPKYHDVELNSCVDVDSKTALTCAEPRVMLFKDGKCRCRGGYVAVKDGQCVPNGLLSAFDGAVYHDMLSELSI